MKRTCHIRLTFIILALFPARFMPVSQKENRRKVKEDEWLIYSRVLRQ